MAEYWEKGLYGNPDEIRKAGGYYTYWGGGDSGDSGSQWNSLGLGGQDAQGNWDPSIGSKGPANGVYGSYSDNNGGTGTLASIMSNSTNSNDNARAMYEASQTQRQAINDPAQNGMTYDPGTGQYMTGEEWTSQYGQNKNNTLRNVFGVDYTPGKELAYNPNSHAPTFDVSTQAGWDALDQQAKVADYGKVTHGISIFDPGYNAAANGGAYYNDMANKLGLNTSGWNTSTKEGVDAARKQVEDYANQFTSLKALTGGWGGTGDPREAATTLYRNDNGTLRAINDPNVTRAPEKGSWLAEHGPAKVAILGALMVASAGAAGIGTAAAGAGAGGGTAGAVGATGTGITGTGGASGLAAYGGSTGVGLTGAGSTSLGAGIGTGAGFGTGGIGALGAGAAGAGTVAASGGLYGSLANSIGLGSEWASLTPVQQAAVSSAMTNAASTGIQGGSLKDVLKSAVIGAATGGAGAYVGSAVNSGLGNYVPDWAAKAGSSAVVGGGLAALQGKNALTGAAMGGLGSLAASGVGGATGNAGLGQLASMGAKQGFGSYLQDAIKDDVTGQRQEAVQGIFAEAQRRGISQQQLAAYLNTPQGRAAMDAEFKKLGSSGTLQSLFG